MKRRYKICFSLIALFFAFVVLLNSAFFIERVEWKYADGKNIGDWLQFDNRSALQIKYGVFYVRGEPVAKVKFCYGKGLIIQDMNTGELGYYVNKKIR